MGLQEDIEQIVSQDFESYDEIKDEWEDAEEENQPVTETKEELYTSEEIKDIKKEINDLKEFQHLARSITRNSKGEVLLTALKKGFAEIERLGGNKKAIIFTESTRTQAYLNRILENTDYKDRIVLFNGSNNDQKSKDIYKKWLEKHLGTDRITGSKSADKRAAIVDYFRDEAVIMIATEAAAEGINLQFCSLVVNYDLPWNPQRIEQRIGRCHRYGQKFDVVVVNFLNKSNAADQRVYQLLKEKFKLFDGIFGASDEVLGSIESGVNFEKRIAQIYQHCRTTEEIQSLFDQLQKELEEQIEDRMKDARNNLLENFDEEVHEKLRVNLQESKEYLSKYEYWLWEITKHYLEPYADFAIDEHSFTLRENPFVGEKIHPGPYKLGKNIDDVNIYRVGHPLAQRIIEKTKSLPLMVQELVFNYSDSIKKINILESLVAKSGWLSVITLTINSFETEDQILLCSVTDAGTELDIEQCKRLFSLPALTSPLLGGDLGVGNTAGDSGVGSHVKNLINQIAQRQQAKILQMNAERNTGFFDTEMEKLDRWAEDVKSSMEIELKELDKEIKCRKTEAKKILNLEEKVTAHRQIKEMEKKRNTMRLNLYQTQDDVDNKKEVLIGEIEVRLKQKIETTELFTVRWKVI